jgi:hypothetical protein
MLLYSQNIRSYFCLDNPADSVTLSVTQWSDNQLSSQGSQELTAIAPGYYVQGIAYGSEYGMQDQALVRLLIMLSAKVR